MRFLLIPIFLFCAASAHASQSMEAFLRRFHENPAREMERLPLRWTKGEQPQEPGFIDRRKVAAAMEFRLATRDRIMGEENLRAISIDPAGKDRPEMLVENGVVVRNLADLEARGLTRSVASPMPWADSYWPFYRGIISNRYASASFPHSKDWATNYQYIRMNPASVVIAGGNPGAIDALSPAEKYDYAVGDWNFTLTNHGWLQGKTQMDKYGSVASWMGICHGWSAAAHMQAPIPAEPVTVISTSGRPVTFYPQDVKALQSMLWANASPPSRFVGSRCNVANPARNRYGRVIDPKCYDTNPGTWHLAVTNQIGINHRSFVMDATYDLQVWNFAVASYQYRYFNPETWKEGSSLRSSMIPIEKYRVDKFKEFRSPETKYVVGIVMDASYVNAIVPTRKIYSDVPLKTIRFIYDLELDAGLNVIGGEWYSNAHPDFLWTFDRGAQAMTVADRGILHDGFSAGGAVPLAWTGPARSASLRGAPLFSFIRGLTGAPIPPGAEFSERSLAMPRMR